MTTQPPVGRVLGTEDATPLDFWVALAADQYLQLDDVVVSDRDVPGRDEPVQLSGIVTQVRARHEGAAFDSDVFLIADGVLPGRDRRGRRGDHHPASSPRSTCRRCPGAAVRRAVGAERDHALFFDRMEQQAADRARPRRRAALRQPRVPRRHAAAPTSTSRGISGVATKTSYATFLLYSAVPLGRARRRGGQHQGARSST